MTTETGAFAHTDARMRYSPAEKETIINFSEAGEDCSVFTYNRPLRRRLEQLAQTMPQECRPNRIGPHSVDFTIPRSWIAIRPPRTATERQKAAARAALEKARQSRPESPRIDD